MSHHSDTVNNEPSQTSTSPRTSNHSNRSNVKKMAEELERGRRQTRDGEPARPKRDLRQERTEPWKTQMQDEEPPERVGKGDRGLDPQRREPWERAGEQAHKPQSDGTSGNSDEGDAVVRLELLRSQLPPQASLHGLRTKELVVPAHITPRAYALDLWLRDNPEYKEYLEPTTPSSGTQDSVPASESASESESGSESASKSGFVSTYKEFPEIPFEKIESHISKRDDIKFRTRVLLVQMLLLQCDMQVRNAWAREYNEWKARAREGTSRLDEGERMAKGWYKAYSKAGRTAEHAQQVAKSLRIDGLQARAFFWLGKADAGIRSWADAAAAFRMAEQYDVREYEEAGPAVHGNNGLTTTERRDVQALREECERRHERAGDPMEKSEQEEEEDKKTSANHGLSFQAKTDSNDEDVEEEDSLNYTGVYREDIEFVTNAVKVVKAVKESLRHGGLRPLSTTEVSDIFGPSMLDRTE